MLLFLIFFKYSIKDIVVLFVLLNWLKQLYVLLYGFLTTEKEKTLSHYALKYGTTVKALAELNNIENRSNTISGETVSLLAKSFSPQ